MVHIPNGVDTQLFQPNPQRRPDPALPPRQIICVSRLHYAKGIDVLLHAWSRMMQAPAEWRAHLKPQLSIVGEGDVRPQLERIAIALGIQDSVEFLGVRNDIVARLQQAWGFVLPSRWEGMPNALLEAMACGLPCVATRVSGSEDVVKHGVNALMVEPEDPAEMAQALRLLSILIIHVAVLYDKVEKLLHWSGSNVIYISYYVTRCGSCFCDMHGDRKGSPLLYPKWVPCKNDLHTDVIVSL